MENLEPSKRRLASRLWLIYTAAAIVGSLLVLAIYVSAYDNTGVTERLRATGAFTRTAMQVLSFPLGIPIGARRTLSLNAALVARPWTNPARPSSLGGRISPRFSLKSLFSICLPGCRVQRADLDCVSAPSPSYGCPRNGGRGSRARPRTVLAACRS